MGVSVLGKGAGLQVMGVSPVLGAGLLMMMPL